MPIRALPPLLVNQIAAGEVIERPASVVKELMENAIDAGAGNISITIEQGGKELIRIVDDGSGIPFDELTLALQPHATSKITTSQELDAIATLGFRGEALASIASVSRISILSRTVAQTEAGLVEGEGDQLSQPIPAGGPVGTAVTVRNLFFNTPARRKFLKTDQTETGRIVDMAESVALAHPDIGFTLSVDGRNRWELPPQQSPRNRALQILGTELESELLELQQEERGIQLWGLLGKPNIARSTTKHQRVYLNGRLIADRTIAHAIKEAYRGLIEPTRFPTIVLFLSMDPALVDVNVHPAKSEVRFRNQAIIHGTILHAVRQTLRDADLTPAFDLQQSVTVTPNLAIPPPLPREFSSGMSTEGTSSTNAPAARAFVDYFRQLNPQQKGFVFSEMKAAISDVDPALAELSEEDSAREQLLPSVRSVAEALQVHSSFIVTQDEHGLVIIDQHALHERVMFEKLKQRLDSGTLESQRLLMPAVVEVNQTQLEALDKLRDLLPRLGIELEQIGPTSVAVHAFTTLLFERGVEPDVFIRELLEKSAAQTASPEPEMVLHEVLDMMACKAAIKAGDRMSDEELGELLRYRESIERSSNCPHGRPTTLRLSIQDLEKQFGRR